MAKSSILFPQELQLYVQLLHISEPSPSRRRWASESRSVPQVLQQKHSICHRLPAVNHQLLVRYGSPKGELTQLESLSLFQNLAEGTEISIRHISQYRLASHTSPQPLQGNGVSSCSIGDSGYTAGDSILFRYVTPDEGVRKYNMDRERFTKVQRLSTTTTLGARPRCCYQTLSRHRG